MAMLRAYFWLCSQGSLLEGFRDHTGARDGTIRGGPLACFPVSAAQSFIVLK